MKHFELYAAGEFLRSVNTLMVLEKYSGKPYATCSVADADILERSVKKAVEVRAVCAELSAAEKYEALMQITHGLREGLTELSETLCIESGKPMIYARAEIERSIQTFTIAAEECKRLPREFLGMDWTVAGKGKEALVKYFPVGVIAGISPFNFPMNLAAHKIAPAIAAGCPIVLKPASTTPLSTLRLARLIDQTSLPKGMVSVLPMDRDTGNLLVTHRNIQMLSFTGSPAVGWNLKSQSGKKKVVLELGGNAGVIVSASADIGQILAKCVTGAFAYSGQICIHAQRFYVHPQRYDVFLKKMCEAAGNLEEGDPLKEETRISCMIDEENASRVESWVNEAIKQGAEVVCGGKRRESYFPPTILRGTHAKMKVNSEEVFGPVICIEPYSGDIEDAVQKINETRFGLQCGIFTDSVRELQYCFEHAEVGGVLHNEVPTLRFDHMPYGGVKDSGLGREGVKYAIRDMMEAKVLVK